MSVVRELVPPAGTLLVPAFVMAGMELLRQLRTEVDNAALTSIDPEDREW